MRRYRVLWMFFLASAIVTSVAFKTPEAVAQASSSPITPEKLQQLIHWLRVSHGEQPVHESITTGLGLPYPFMRKNAVRIVNDVNHGMSAGVTDPTRLLFYRSDKGVVWLYASTLQGELVSAATMTDRVTPMTIESAKVSFEAELRFWSGVTPTDSEMCATSGDFAIAACTREIQRNPKAVSELINRAGRYIHEKGEYDRAIKDLRQALGIPKGLSPYGLHAAKSNLGRAYLGKGEYKRAIAAYNEAIQLYPKHEEELLGRGVAKLKAGDIAGGNKDIAAAKAMRASVIDEWVKDWSKVAPTLADMVSGR